MKLFFATVNLLCFGLRFGEGESGAQAEVGRSRSITTVAVPQVEARRYSAWLSCRS